LVIFENLIMHFYANLS